MSLGNGDVYFLENNTGDLWLYDESANSLTETNDDFASSSNTDGAGCGIGLSGGDEFVPTASASEGSCSGSERLVEVTLNNSNSDVDVNYVVTYSGVGKSGDVTTGTTVSAGASPTVTTPVGFSSGTVTISWYAELTTHSLRTPSSGTTDISVSVSGGCGGSISHSNAEINTCSSGAATASLTLTASGSTMFVDVDWSDNDFSTTTNLADGQSIWLRQSS